MKYVLVLVMVALAGLMSVNGVSSLVPPGIRINILTPWWKAYGGISEPVLPCRLVTCTRKNAA